MPGNNCWKKFLKPAGGGMSVTEWKWYKWEDF